MLIDAGWSLGDATGPGSPLHNSYLEATTMTFAGITACQVGTAFAARTSRASLREIGVFSNPLLLWGILFELAFAAAIIYLPALQHLFATAGLGARELAILATFPFIVWGTDELRRWWLRRRAGRAAATTVAAASGCRDAAMPLIETTELTKYYGETRALDGVSMTVEPGEAFGFLGPNGAGKTTLIRVLTDLLHPSSGSATVFGLDTRADERCDPRQARQPPR